MGTKKSQAKEKVYYMEFKATYSGWATMRAKSKEEALKFAKESDPDEFLKDQNYKPDSIEITLIEETEY